MTYEFRPAVRESVALIIGVFGPSGGGKTYSAMRLATGLADGKRFAVIDTEARRALHYASNFAFDHCELHPPFHPQRYLDAIKAADDKGYPVIVVDSMTHSWAGEGGVLDMHEAEMQRMAGDNYQKREAVKMAAWIKPKMAHKAMVAKLLQCRAHLIICLRAEEKVAMVKDEKGKTQIVPRGWVPVCAKDFPYELTASFLLTPDAPGIPQPMKLQEQHKFAFPTGQPITEDTGRRLAQWAKGGAPSESRLSPTIPPSGGSPGVSARDATSGPPVPALPGLDTQGLTPGLVNPLSQTEEPGRPAETQAPPSRDWAKFGTWCTEQVFKCVTVAQLDAVKLKIDPELPNYQAAMPEKYGDLLSLLSIRRSELLNG